MLRSGWDARLRSRARLTAQGRYGPQHDLVLRQALAHDIQSAWVEEDRKAFQLLAELASQLDGQWRLRGAVLARRLLLPLKRAVRSVVHLRRT
jgi:hypothetical protein